MTKSLRSYPNEEKEFVAKRRLQNGTSGLGFWAAVDFGNYNMIDAKNFLKNKNKKENKNV